MKRESDRNRRVPTVIYPKHAFEPVDLLTFVEMDGFGDDWRRLSLNDEDLFALQAMLMLKPRGGLVISGTGGLRKMRFAPSRWNTGKSGATRVCYVYFQDYGVVLLVIAYAKNEMDDIPDSHKKIIRQMIERQERVFSTRIVR